MTTTATATEKPQAIQIIEEKCLGEHLIDLGHDGSVRIQNADRDGKECVILSDGEVATLREYLRHI